MPMVRSLKHRLLLTGAILLVTAIALPQLAAAQGGGPAAHYSPSYTDASWAHIFELHRSWGNVVPGGVRSPNGYWCVHPDYRPGQVLMIRANGNTILCTVGDMVNSAHVAQWRSRWVIELSWSAFVALGLNQRNYVDSVQLGHVGGWTEPAAESPAAPAPEPLPAVRFFPETGHTVGHGFLDYWRSNGGIPVFGYPLSNELDENGRTVQYFERAVFEFHPDNGSGHKVQLRRLGSGAAADLRHLEPFQPTGSDSANGQRYFSRTGHSLAERFAGYWNDNGGVGVFGYPLSSAFEQDGTLVQYFERAVFEWHPENPDGHQILLRRLGYEAFRANGY